MTAIIKVMVVVMAAIASEVTAYEPVLSVAKEEWELFKITYNKNYENIVEEKFRMKIFMENKLKIIEHNKLYAQNKTSYEMETNHLSDMLTEEVVATMQGLQVQMDGMDENSGSTFIPPNDDIPLPPSVDWRLKGVVTRVKYQGGCGSCWAFSATGAMEGQHARKTGRLESLSEQNLVDCCHRCHGCGGGLMQSAFRCVLEEGGIESEFEYPYTAHDGVCKYEKRRAVATVTGWVNIPRTELALLQAVAVVGPISVGIDASSSFMHYRSGVYYDPECSPAHLNHGVLVVGYGTENGMDYWLVKNSWGSHWGDEGYIKMARNKSNMCGIASLASFPLV